MDKGREATADITVDKNVVDNESQGLPSSVNTNTKPYSNQQNMVGLGSGQVPMIPEPKPKRNKSKIIVLLVVITLVIVAIPIAFFLLGKSKDDTSKTESANSNTEQHDNGLALKVPHDFDQRYDFFREAGVKEFTTSDKDKTLSAVSELLSGFELDQAFWDDESSSLIALGIGSIFKNDSQNRDTYRKEMYLFAKPHLKKLPSGIKDDSFQSADEDDTALKVINKYTDQQLTSEVKNTITSSGVVDDLNNKLDEGYKKDVQSVNVVVMDFNSYDSRQKSFAKEHYMYGVSPKMWVESFGDQIYILMTKEYAQSFIENPRGSERSSIVHELVHSYNPFNRGELGRSVEERRAELLSGDKSAYYDAKQMFIYLTVFSGYDATSLLEGTSSSPINFYTTLYKDLGVKLANNIVASWPSVFLGEAQSPSAEVNGTIGGYDNIIKQAVVIGDKDKSAKDKRIADRYKKLLTILKTKDRVIEDLEYNLADSYKMPTAAQLMKSAI